MPNITDAQLAQIVADAVSKALAAQPKAMAPASSARPAFDPAAKDAQIRAAFKRKGFNDVVLMDRADPSKAFNVKPFKLWLNEGRIVRRGQKSVRGLFHVHQTDALPAKPTPPKGSSKKVKLHAVPTQPGAA
jgi:hypothetical protein